MDEQQYYTIIIRHSDSTKWMISDPILTFGEYGVEDDTHRVKRGDGEKTWSELPYESFGLEYLITYSNLSGEVEDNEALVAALNKKISKDIFNDSQNGVITEISVSHTDGRIATFNKITKNISEGTNIPGVLHIKSADNSLEGYWTIDEQGAQILDLRARCAIDDYTPGLRYSEDQLCYYNNSLYRAKSNFTAEETFNESLWTLLCTLQSSGIKYDNRTSGLYANNVKDAIDELVVLDGTRVTKTRSSNKVYGTNDLGEQYLYDKDDLRTVDSVNGIRADVNKNIHLDAGQINYNDARPELGTVRNILDSKVDKTVAGEGAKILRGARLNYTEATGQLQLIKDKLSLEDGTSAEEIDTINVVSETELQNAETEINDTINAEVTTLNNRIDNEVNTLNNTINTKEQGLQSQIDDTNTELERVESESKERDTNLNTQINNAVNTLNNNILHQVDIINDRIDTEVETLNSTIDDEVADLNDTINAKETTLNNRITTEVGTLNNRITTEVNTLNESINTKIDKDIADNIVTGIEVATHDRQPTIKVTSNNTSSKRAVYDYIHFGTDGDIKTRMEDEDHLIIDSTDIDARIDANVTHLNLVDGRLNSHDTDIASLKEHDVNHDRAIAANSAQIAEHETRLDNLETDVDNLETDLTAEVTNRQTADANLSTRIADNAVRIANNTQAIRDNADSIDQLAQTVEENIEALTNSKADKTFANTTDNKVVGKLESDNLTGSELLNLKQTLVSPVNGASSVERIRIISSDNTVIATRNNDGTIDLKTNLDTDVNYFVTTEILNTTIASVNTIQLNSLTPTDKQNVEVQDIISDPEGTWARVSSVDTTQGICTAVTFKKHAQAVWGTIKGNIADQTDLQTQFSEINESISDEIQNREAEDIILQQNIDDVNDSLQQEISDRTDAESQIVQDLEDVKADVSDLQDGKIDKTTDINKVYGTDENGEQTTYDKNDFGKVDTVNNVQPDANKNVELTAADINHIKGNYSNNISQLLDTIIDVMFTTTVSNTQKIQLYVQDSSYTSSQDYAYIDSELNVQYTTDTERYVTYEEDDGVILMAKVMNDFTSDSTQATVLDSFMYDVEQGNLKLVGIPEQLVPSTPSEPEETFDILNKVMGTTGDTYDGLGGTEEEVEEILDEVLGN